MDTKLSRRSFAFACGAAASVKAAEGDRPNVLWITCEDTGPALGCYGDNYANTPTLDKLAERGARYRMAWSNAPVCAPARTTIIAGMYPPSTGSEHMRSMVRLPEGMKMYPCYLREAGYYATNNSKEDYNLEHTGTVWDESSPRAHWRKRKAGQPFFSIFNFVTTHESQIRRTPHKLVHDPAKARVPAYHPDTPEVRHDWAQYYDNITTMDGQAAEVLKQLQDDGLAENTIVFFYGDHGAGMPRSKRWPYNSGLQVPLIVYVPEKFKQLAPEGYGAGAVIQRLISFVDLAPTLLSIVGVQPPKHMQGRAFMGKHTVPARQYNFGFRGRMDERYDMVRSCTDGRYVYLRQFMPHKKYGQHVAYMFEMPTTQAWKKAFDSGKATDAQKIFWGTKPPEELYDLESDKDEVKNLASSPAHKAILTKMRKAVHDWMVEIRDVGLLPENEIASRAGQGAPYEVGHDAKRYPFERVLDTAEIASMMEERGTKTLVDRLADSDSAVRYWAALGLQMRGEKAVQASRAALRKLLDDQAPAPRIAAAEALGRFGNEQDAADAVRVLSELAPADKNGSAVTIMALNALTSMGPRAKAALPLIKTMQPRDPKSPQRLQEYPVRLVKSLTADLS
jgi:uncharacterized sulfatase